MSFTNETIWIIGASSGIGKATAIELAGQGATLILSARDEAALQQLNQQLGGKHHVLPLDVSSHDQVTDAMKQAVNRHSLIHRILFFAAIYRPNDVDKLDIDFAQKLIDVNIMGAIRVSYAALHQFATQPHGQLVLCGSVAGYTGLPGGQPYSASKAAIMNLAESLHAETDDHIDIKLISPGFVRTRMTDKNQFDMPLRIEPEDAAKAIAKGLKAKAFEIHFPKAFTFAVKFLRLLPYPLTLWITGKTKGKM